MQPTTTTTFQVLDNETADRLDAMELLLESIVEGRAEYLCPRNRALLLKKQGEAMQKVRRFSSDALLHVAIASELDEWCNAREFEDFIDWARAAGQELHADPLCHLPSNYGWRRWATTEPAPTPVAANPTDDAFFASGVIELDSDAVFAEHAGQPLSGAILHEAAMAEHKQALRLQAEYQAREAERRQRDRRQRRELERKQKLLEQQQTLEQQQQQQQQQQETTTAAAAITSQLPLAAVKLTAATLPDL